MERQIHRRKSSQSDDENTVIISSPPKKTIVNELPRSRVNSTPAQPLLPKSPSLPNHPPSAGPYRSHAPPSFRSSISNPNSLTVSLNGHSRTRSTSTPFSPPLPSPLSFSFPVADTESQSPTIVTSTSLPDASSSGQKHTRKHSRLHSRNLSIYFPRPGSLPQHTISEDGSQELELRPPDEGAPVSSIPSAGSSVAFPARRSASLAGPGPITPLGAGFSFGRRPPAISVPTTAVPTPPIMSSGPSSASSSKRRGHHHKHSLSHNFFSFLEPGSTTQGDHVNELHTQPTPIPISPWNPISPFPSSAKSISGMSSGMDIGSDSIPPSAPATLSTFRTQNGNGYVNVSESETGSNSDVVDVNFASSSDLVSTVAPVWALMQFALGASMWVCGQQIGLLACTGVGYWIVFDAFGVGVEWVVPRWLGSEEKSTGKAKARRAYGNARIETVLMFAQAVYLMFASVYVCKETVEHLLLSAGGGGEGHHHHRGDEEADFGPQFPLILTLLSFVSLGVSAVVFGNHAKLVEITGNRLPTLPTLIRTLTSARSQYNRSAFSAGAGMGIERDNHLPIPTSTVGKVLCNPYVFSPVAFCLAILFARVGIDSSQHTSLDLVLAALITVVTFNVAYSASVVLGTVLLQTAPKRGLPGGRMEAFLRVMKEVERHPQVLHLPAPHIWQLTPAAGGASLGPTSYGYGSGSSVVSVGGSLVVTLELHVRSDLGDDDVVALTRWAWERCVGALGGVGVGSSKMRRIGEKDGKESGRGVDVTIGVVRG